MKISKRKQILTRYDGPRENVKRKEKSDKYKSENILVDFLERVNTSAAHNTLTYKNSRQSPRTAIQEQEQMGNVCNLQCYLFAVFSLNNASLPVYIGMLSCKNES